MFNPSTKHMKSYRSRVTLPLCCAAALLAGAAQSARGAADLTVNTFDDESSTAGFWLWWGGIDRQITWDSTMDAAGQSTSGSVKLSFAFDNANSDNQYCVAVSLAGQSAYNGSVVAFPADYSALEFDVLWDTNSTVAVDQFNNSQGDPAFNLGIAGVVANTGGTVDWGGGSISYFSPAPTLNGDGKWQHISLPLPLTKPGFAGIAFKKWQPTGANGINGTVNIWLDNIKLIGATAPPPAPTMAIQKNAAHGVQIFASAGGQYQRQSIAATSEAAQALSWIDNPEPVTYSLTIADMPANPNFQVHVFLSPDSGGANSPDWNDPNVIFLDIRRNADGTGQATFRYKTNAPNNNDMLYFQNNAPFDGRLATLATPAALGTWSLKFQNNTNITLTGPGNSVTNFTMLAEHAALFRPASTVTASFGVQPNQTDLIGQSATFSEVKITSGTTTVLDDTFQTADPTQQVDPALWTRRMDDVNGITVLTAEAGYVLTWTVPDTGFVLRSTANVTAPSWTELQVPVIQVSGQKRAVISGTNLPAGNLGFFQLVKPADGANN